MTLRHSGRWFDLISFLLLPRAEAVKVVDASAIAALIFGEPEGEALADALRSHALVAPALLPSELASVCLKKMRRHPEAAPALRRSFALLGGMSIDSIAVDYEATLDLAQTAGLTGHDAAHLWLARTLDAELITLDRQLAMAARR